MQRNTLEKIVVSVGVGKLRQMPAFEEKILPEIIKDLSALTGQYPAKRGAKKSIANFKTRQGDVIGAVVTLRGKKMTNFLERLVNVALPRVRDFKGIDPKHFDKKGNLSIGMKEHTVFPEINPEKAQFPFGLQITLVVKAKNKEEAVKLIKDLAVPLKK
ncbi:MAG: 50S ribosomal protein L5 [Candidatus Colwellbacteria bacterium]|nr:50S ribosomal protein L5 [Candidatus Colwellbacteria bacterium]